MQRVHRLLVGNGEHLVIRTGRMTNGKLRPGDQPLLAPLSQFMPKKLLGRVDQDRRYVVDLHLPGKTGLSQRRSFGALLEPSLTYEHVMQESTTPVPAA